MFIVYVENDERISEKYTPCDAAHDRIYTHFPQRERERERNRDFYHKDL